MSQRGIGTGPRPATGGSERTNLILLAVLIGAAATGVLPSLPARRARHTRYAGHGLFGFAVVLLCRGKP